MGEIILVAHGELAVGMKQSLEMIFGQVNGIRPVVFNKEDGLDSLENKIREKLPANSEGVLIIADLFCGTPYNAGCSLAMKEEEREIQVISGMSLPLVLEAASLLETEPINEITSKLKVLAAEVVQVFERNKQMEEEEDF